MLTQVIKSDNLLAVCIPQEMRFADGIRQVDIVRNGDALVIRPIQSGSLKEVTGAFAAFPAGFMAAGRERNEQAERNWG